MVVKIVCNLTEIYCSFVPPHQTRELFIYFFPSSVAVSTQPCGRGEEKGYRNHQKSNDVIAGATKMAGERAIDGFFWRAV